MAFIDEVRDFDENKLNRQVLEDLFKVIMTIDDDEYELIKENSTLTQGYCYIQVKLTRESFNDAYRKYNEDHTSIRRRHWYENKIVTEDIDLLWKLFCFLIYYDSSFCDDFGRGQYYYDPYDKDNDIFVGKFPERTSYDDRPYYWLARRIFDSVGGDDIEDCIDNTLTSASESEIIIELDGEVYSSEEDWPDMDDEYEDECDEEDENTSEGSIIHMTPNGQGGWSFTDENGNLPRGLLILSNEKSENKNRITEEEEDLDILD